MLWDKDFYDNLPYSIIDGIYYIDKSKRVTYWDKEESLISRLLENKNICEITKKSSFYLEYDIKEDCKAKIEDSISRAFNLGVNYISEIYLFEKNRSFPPVMLKVALLDSNNEDIKGIIEFFTIRSIKLSLLKVIDNLIKFNNYDSLTYTANYEFIFNFIEEKIDKYKKNNLPFGYVLFTVNIDNNFYYNEILKLVGINILRNIRIIDTVGRIKDNNFLCIISNIKEEQLIKISNRIKNTLEGTDFLIDNKKIRINLSVKSYFIKANDSVMSLKEKIENELK